MQYPSGEMSEKAECKNYNELETSNENIDDEEQDKDVGANDLCLVCGQFVKNRELWIRCVSCENWAHKPCTDTEKSIHL